MTSAPMTAGLAFLPMGLRPGALLAPREERVYPRVRRLREELARRARGDDRPAVGVEEDAVVGDREDARELVRHDDHRRTEAVPELQDQIVEAAGADRVEPRRGLVEEQISGSSAIARARPARFCMPPLI